MEEIAVGDGNVRKKRRRPCFSYVGATLPLIYDTLLLGEPVNVGGVFRGKYNERNT